MPLALLSLARTRLAATQPSVGSGVKTLATFKQALAGEKKIHIVKIMVWKTAEQWPGRWEIDKTRRIGILASALIVLTPIALARRHFFLSEGIYQLFTTSSFLHLILDINLAITPLKSYFMTFTWPFANDLFPVLQHRGVPQKTSFPALTFMAAFGSLAHWLPSYAF